MKELPESAKQKIEKAGEINLNAGSGTATRVGFVNYDINPKTPEVDIVDDLRNVGEWFEPDSITNIVCFEVLEHFRRDEWRDILGRLCRLVKSGGRIHIRVPYIPDIVDENRRGYLSDYDMFRTIYGGQRHGDFEELDYHQCGMTIAMLKDEFSKHGFRVEEANHVFGLGILHLIALKQ